MFVPEKLDITEHQMPTQGLGYHKRQAVRPASAAVRDRPPQSLWCF